MDIDDAVKAVEFIRPKKVVPMHYNTWPPIEADPEEFATKVGAGGRSVAVIMTPNDSLEL